MSDDADRTPQPGSTPPPGPWWSQPSDGPWGAPEAGLGGQPDDNPTTVYGQPYAEPAAAGPTSADPPACCEPGANCDTQDDGATYKCVLVIP